LIQKEWNPENYGRAIWVDSDGAEDIKSLKFVKSYSPVVEALLSFLLEEITLSFLNRHIFLH
jgi:hypothetical protein